MEYAKKHHLFVTAQTVSRWVKPAEPIHLTPTLLTGPCGRRWQSRQVSNNAGNCLVTESHNVSDNSLNLAQNSHFSVCANRSKFNIFIILSSF